MLAQHAGRPLVLKRALVAVGVVAIQVVPLSSRGFLEPSGGRRRTRRLLLVESHERVVQAFFIEGAINNSGAGGICLSQLARILLVEFILGNIILRRLSRVELNGLSELLSVRTGQVAQ